MDVHLRELRYFVAVAEEGNFGRAAARLHITQPTLSQQITKLERQMRTSLLERDHRGVRLTPAGARLLAASRELLKDWQVAEAEVVRQPASQPLRIDVWSEHQGWPQILCDIAAANPELRSDISMRRGVPAAAEALRHEDIDLAIGAVDGLTLGAGLHTTPVRIRPCCLAVSRRHRFARRDAVSCADLAGARIWMPSNLPTEIAPLFRCLITRFGAVPVEDGLALGVFQALETVGRDPDLALIMVFSTIPADADARLVPLTDPEPCLRSSLIWRSSDTNPRLAELLRMLTTLAAEESWLSFDQKRQWLLGAST